MRNLAILVALGWFWLTFYGTGPLTSWTEVAVGGLALAGGCLLASLWGAAAVLRRRPRRSVRLGRTEGGASAGLRR